MTCQALSWFTCNTYFEVPERVAALILVAPAILAPLTITTPKLVKENLSGQDNHKSSISKSPIFGLYKMLSKIIKNIADTITHMIWGTIHMLYCLSRKFLSAMLRSSLAIMPVMNMFETLAVICHDCWSNCLSDGLFLHMSLR